ncbi:DNA-3-methyladenine glycosylase 2 family protein [Enterococcus sp. AZ072]|uniref:DNA-3-methyladenine glycosylase 2 family protein n=1 Tax=unclassified Enterococcus TaxID=2608891 RepID=UPI003D2A4420
MEQLTNDYLYSAFKAKDTRFDGRFFIGITTTQIYCRPVCRARQAKAENCRYFKTAAEAELAGFRPCLLCRPEQAPGNSVTDAQTNLAAQVAKVLEEHCGSGIHLKELAEELGYTDRHLRRVFLEEYHVSPIQYLQTCRLLLAKSLLTDTNLSVIEVAMASGFGSLRRFNALFQKHYQLTPTALRKESISDQREKDKITLALGYRPPYRWQELLNFLEKRAIEGVERVQDNTYLRTVRLANFEGKECSGWIKIQSMEGKNLLAVTLSESLLPVLPQVLSRIRQLFDLYCDPTVVYETLNHMENFACGTRIPGCFDPFEMAVRAILGQQITVKAASTLAARIVQKFGTPIQTPFTELTHTFPTPQTVLTLEGTIEENLGQLGVIATRSRTIKSLAERLSAGTIRFGPQATPEAEVEKLLAIPGIGHWTAHYLAMRALNWPDAFLETDVGIKKALAPLKPKEMLQLAENWRPWRSYATVSLWNSL